MSAADDALLRAARMGDAAGARAALDGGADIECADAEARSAFCVRLRLFALFMRCASR
jgi:hypothetical protein